MDATTWVPDEIPLDRPNAARIYDYYVGGYHNFEVDRLAADRLAQINPDVRLASWVNRAFLRRCVRFLVEQGIDQFLDIGSGIPTVGNVHEIAQAADPSARVVYVDIDPVAVAHSQAMLQGNPGVAAICADARQPDQILGHAEVRRLLDWSRPAAVLFVAVLHLLPDDDQAYRAVVTLRDVLTAGSYVAVAHPSCEDAPPTLIEQINKLTEASASRYQYRTLAKIRRFFDGLDLIEPGLVYTPLWRPESPQDVLIDEPQRAFCFAGVGLKPS
jgi:SAM-dependent methyltransferase